MSRVRPTWNEWASTLAGAASTRGDCARSQVGAVLVDIRTHQVHAVGFNGVKPGMPGCLDGACPRGRLDQDEFPPGGEFKAIPGAPCIATHAEENCLKWSRRWWRGKWWYRRKYLYLTRGPCDGCLDLMGRYGVGGYVYPSK